VTNSKYTGTLIIQPIFTIFYGQKNLVTNY
jgi:hypothetical protein